MAAYSGYEMAEPKGGKMVDAWAAASGFEMVVQMVVRSAVYSVVMSAGGTARRKVGTTDDDLAAPKVVWTVASKVVMSAISTADSSAVVTELALVVKSVGGSVCPTVAS